MDHEYYYWKLIAERESTGSELLMLVEIPASLGKHDGLRSAVEDFSNSLGPTWKVYHQALSKQYYEMRSNVKSREEAIFLKGQFND